MRRFAWSVLLACALAAASLPALADAVTDRAARLIESHHAHEAYALLAPLEPKRAGDPVFDYLLGVSAIDGGHPQHGVFALERVLAVQPGNLQARAEIARAYYILGEKDAAKHEFEAVRSAGVPRRVQATIDRFLSAIEASRSTRFGAYLEASLGYDNNVNSATSLSQIAIPALGGTILQIAPAAERTGDGFFGLGGGVSGSHLLGERWALVGNASFAGDFHNNDTQFDTGLLDAAGGLRWSAGDNALTGALQAQSYRLDDHRLRDVAGGSVQWQHSFNQARQGTAFLQYSQLTYPGQSIRDADRAIVGVAFAQAFAGRTSPVLFATLYGGSEKPQADPVPYLGHKPWGARLGGQISLGGTVTANASVGYEHRKYGGEDPLFLVTRVDRQLDVTAGLTWLIAPSWTLRPLLAYTDNRSNIDIDRFTRTVVQVSLRKDF